MKIDEDREDGDMIRRDKDGWHINFDTLFLYLVALVGLIILAIKAIRWAVTS